MDSTRLSLLTQAGSGSARAWQRLVELYQPLVYAWLRHHEIAHHDAEELTQDVLSVVVEELPSFSHSGRTGAFRCWLRQITANRAKGFWRAGKIRPTASGKSSFLEIMQQLADPHSQLSRRWDREHDQHVLRQLLLEVETEVEPVTLAAFQRQVFQGVSAEDVSRELGVTVGAAYSAKSRVLRKLRQAAAGLLDESVLS